MRSKQPACLPASRAESKGPQIDADLPSRSLPNPTAQQHRLNNKGYQNFYRLLPSALCERLLETAQNLPDSAWRKLFGQNGWDGKRKWAPVPSSLAKEVFDAIGVACRTFFPDGTPNKLIFLKSWPGGQPQPAHRDFSAIPDDQDLYDYTSLPASVLIGIQDGSFIYGYGWNRQVALEAEKEVITFGKGDALISRGDFIHGGGDYQEVNIRIHCYFDPPQTKGRQVRKDNSIDLIRVIPKRIPGDEAKKSTCFIFGCKLTFTCARLMRKHIRKDHGIYFNNYPRTSSKKQKTGNGTLRSGAADEHEEKAPANVNANDAN